MGTERQIFSFNNNKAQVYCQYLKIYIEWISLYKEMENIVMYVIAFNGYLLQRVCN